MSEPEPRRIETSDDITHCLETVALFNGNVTRAARNLTEDGWKTDRFALLRLREKHPDVYERVQDALVIRQADKSDENAYRMAAITGKLLDRLENNPDEIEIKDIPAAARNLSTARGIEIDKSNVLRGRPSIITEQRDASQIMRALASRLGVQSAVDTDAVEYDELSPGQSESPAP